MSVTYDFLTLPCTHGVVHVRVSAIEYIERSPSGSALHLNSGAVIDNVTTGAQDLLALAGWEVRTAPAPVAPMPRGAVILTGAAPRAE